MKTKNYLKMKKITLLLVAAVFAIGIQSCSTEETVLEEEVQINQIENVEKIPFLEGCNFFVRYPRHWTPEDREDFITYATENIFSSVFVFYEDDCYEVDEWRVPCDELYKIIRTDVRTVNATDAQEKTENDDNGIPTAAYSLKPKNNYYETCTDVPLHGQL